jgi:O-antigen/teichoic acid export membrane protein
MASKITDSLSISSYEPTLKEKTAKGLFWGGFNSGSQQIINFAFGIYFARKLSADDYGMIGLLAIFYGIATTLSNGGFASALINKKEATEKDYNAVFWFSFSVSIGIYCLCFFSAPLIAAFFREPELIPLSRVYFLSFIFHGIGMVSCTILTKQLKIKQIAIIDVSSLIISCIIGFILVVHHYSYWALAVQSVVFLLLSIMFKIVIAKWKPDFKFDFTPLKDMFSFSIKLLITGIFIHISTNIFSVILGKFYSKTEVGNYSQGQKWSAMGIGFINNMITYIMQPVLVQINDDQFRQKNVLRKMIRFGSFISFPMMLGLMFIGREFIVITIGDKWLPAVPFLCLFCVWGAFAFINAIYTNLIVTKEKSNIYMNVTIAIGILQLIIVAIMYHWGIIPMVIGYICMFFIGLLIWHHYVHKLIGINIKEVMRDITPYLLATVGSILIAWFITQSIMNVYILLFAKILIVALLYLLIIRALGSVIYRESISFILNRFQMK